MSKVLTVLSAGTCTNERLPHVLFTRHFLASSPLHHCPTETQHCSTSHSLHLTHHHLSLVPYLFSLAPHYKPLPRSQQRVQNYHNAAIMNPPASFYSLPPEMVDNICQDFTLEKEDLISLRLTSKSCNIHLSASKEFAKRYFTEVFLLYTRYSLQKFVEICRHSVFGPAVRRVRLSYVRFPPDRFADQAQNIFDSRFREIGPQERRENLDNAQLLLNRIDEEECLDTSGDDEALLATGFAALSRWHHPLELGVSSSEHHALGQNFIYSHSDISKDGHWECDILGTIALLCRAATSSKRVVQVLHIQGVVWYNLADGPAHWLNPLAQLPELQLSIWPAEDVVMRQITGLEEMVTKLLKKAALLRILHLESDIYSDQDHVRKIVSTISTMKVEKLKLTGIDLHRGTLFRKHIKSVHHLVLCDCKVEIGFMNVMRSIQENFPHLEYLWLSGTSQHWIRGKFEFKGTQRVTDGIERLIQLRLAHFDDPEWTIPWDSEWD